MSHSKNTDTHFTNHDTSVLIFENPLNRKHTNEYDIVIRQNPQQKHLRLTKTDAQNILTSTTTRILQNNHTNQEEDYTLASPPVVLYCTTHSPHHLYSQEDHNSQQDYTDSVNQYELIYSSTE
jgi:hypothetical protein